MRTPLLVVWLALPFGAWAYHEGPGQDRVLLEDVQELVDSGHRAVGEESWALAVTKFEEALETLPEEGHQTEAEWIRLELNKARMQASKLPEARSDLAELVDELVDPDREVPADPELLTEARRALASSQYYMTWLMRLEGHGPERWEPEIEAARQNFRLLEREAQGDRQLVARAQEDLESAIRLARMDLGDLQGLPLPSQ